MKQTYRLLAGLVALGVLVQAGSVAFGCFKTAHDLDSGALKSIGKNYDGNVGHMIHGVDGQVVIPVIGLILLIVSFLAARSVPQARKWAGIVFGLIVLQVVLAIIGFGVPLFGALHGINALFVLGAAVRAMGLTSEPMAAQTETTAVPA